jgi:hypothetical protein
LFFSHHFPMNVRVFFFFTFLPWLNLFCLTRSFHDWVFKDQILSMASITRPSSSSHWFWKCDRNSRMWMFV